MASEQGLAQAPGIGAEALRALHDVIKSVHASLDLPVTLDSIARGVVEASGFQVAAVNLLVEDRWLETVAVAGSDEARAVLLGQREPADNIRRMLDLSERWSDQVRFLGHEAQPATMVEVFWTPDLEPRDELGAWHPEDILSVLMTAPDGQWLGVLSVDVPVDGRRPGPVVQQILEIFADHAAIAIMHARMHEQLSDSRTALEHEATHDVLTGLENRAALAKHAQLQASADEPVGILVADLDGFKAVNDAHGHQAGDEVLRAVANRIRGCTRDRDTVIRAGGDEFVVLVFGADAVGGLPGLEERLTRVIADPIVTSGGVHRVGVSTGSAVATAPMPLSVLMAEADSSMYDRKRRVRA